MPEGNRKAIILELWIKPQYKQQGHRVSWAGANLTKFNATFKNINFQTYDSQLPPHVWSQEFESTDIVPFH